MKDELKIGDVWVESSTKNKAEVLFLTERNVVYRYMETRTECINTAEYLLNFFTKIQPKKKLVYHEYEDGTVEVTIEGSRYCLDRDNDGDWTRVKSEEL